MLDTNPFGYQRKLIASKEANVRDKVAVLAVEVSRDNSLVVHAVGNKDTRTSSVTFVAGRAKERETAAGL